MGTDIHFFVESRVDANSPWRSADEWTNDRGYRHVVMPFYDGRNYDLFAILADVRNGTAFAGVKTGSRLVPMHEPRGWPLDISDEVAEEDVDHTPSWCSLREIMEYDWTRVQAKTGLANIREWARWMTMGEPEDYCGGVSGPGVREISAGEVARHMEALGAETAWQFFHHEAERQKLAKSIGHAERDIYIRLNWSCPYYHSTMTFLGETVPRLWRLGAPDNVRCLYYFDS